jgi:hypothetical protein
MSVDKSSERPVRHAPPSRLKAAGYFILFWIVAVALLLLVRVAIHGMVWVSGKIWPWLFDASEITLVVCVVVLLPLCIFRKTRPWAGLGFYISSYIFGSLLFAFSCIVAYEIWGYVGLIVGLVLAGFGVVPVAFFAALFHAEWTILLDIVFGLVLTFGTRIVGLRLIKDEPLA